MTESSPETEPGPGPPQDVLLQGNRRIRRGAMLAYAVLFALVAPAVGAAGLLMAAWTMAGEGGGSPAAFLQALPIALLVGYLAGVLPAGAAGLAVGAVVELTDRPVVVYPAAVVLGGLAPVAAFGWMFFDPTFWVVFLAPLGASAGLVCTFLARALRVGRER